jgi:diacylglycerol kinase
MQKFSRSVLYACKGIAYCMQKERNFKIQLVCAVAAAAAGLFFKISGTEWLALLLCIALVLSLEMANTAIERLCDHVQAEHHINIRVIKDVAAGAVLLSAAITLICGCIIFIPKIISFIHSIQAT